jgi:hypothetical protein
MEEIWPLLSSSTREWLLANNGDAVPPDIAAEIDDQIDAAGADDVWEREPATGPAGPAPVEDDDEGEDEEEDELRIRYLADTVIDWIEAHANDE